MSLATERHSLLVPLDGSGCRVTDVGGKAAGLDRLAAHGFPIPPSLGLTVWGYRAFAAEPGLASWLEELRQSPLPEPAALESAVAEIELRFLEAPMPAEVAAAITEAAGPMLAEGPIAVRSSATAEDLGIASFAGQYRTYVRVADLEAVARAVRLCWASLWLPAARAYRQHNDIDETDLAMGVVLQAMIEPDWSGVAFTHDTERRDDVMRIEVVAGLGEALVSGRITPDDFIVRRDTLAIDGTDHASPPMFLEDLARLLLQVEERLDEPQDVEWACTAGTLVLLQTRPITVSGPTTALDDGFDGPTGSTDVFTPRGVVEMLPGVVSPLLWSINAPMIESAFRVVAASMGDVALEAQRPFVGRFRGRAALNLSALRDLALRLPGGSAAAVEEQFLGRALSEEHAGEGPRGLRLRPMLRARAAQRRIADEVELGAAAARGIVALGIDLADLPARRLLAYRSQVRDLAWRLVSAEVAASSAAAAAYRGLELLLHRWFDEREAAAWAQRVTAGTIAGDAVGVSFARRLHDAVVRGAARTPRLRSALAARPAHRIGERVRQLGPDTEPFLREVEWIVRSQGSRAIYGGPTWAEEQTWVWEQIAIQAALDVEPPAVAECSALAELETQLHGKRGWRVLRVLTGQVVDLRLRWLRRQVAEAVRFLRLREQAKAALLALGGEERRILVEGGRRLAASRQLAGAEDIELLSDGEFVTLVLGGHPPSDADLYRRRRVAERCGEAGSLPETFMGAPGTEPALDVPDSATLRGWAASPGVVDGTARIIGSLAEGARLERGDVLVARSTDPSWTPLLMTAAGLVLEEGGPLSHGAIVAREFGLPAVLNVPHATTWLDDGEMIEVDGFDGVVRRLAEAGKEAEAS